MAFIYGSTTNCKVRNGQTRTEYECRLGYQVNSQDITNNTSNVTLRLECRSISSSYSTKGSSGLTSVIDGTTVKSNAAVDMSNTNVWQDFGARTITIAHNADGTCSVSKSGSFTCTAGSSQYSLSSGSASVTVAPATIPRATTPTVSSSSVNMGSAVTISTPRASSSFTHTLTYSFGSSSGQIAANVTTSYSWTPPLTLANQVPSATSGTCTITCKTYNGSTLIGTKTVSLTLVVPSSVVPTIGSVTLSEGSSSVPSSWGVYVQNRSKLHVVTTASGAYSSTIKSYKITGIDGNTYNSSNFVSNTLTQNGNKTITVTVTDSRGRTATTTTTYTCLYYANPSISSASAVRCLSDGTASEEGTYLKYTFKANVSPVSNKNTHTYKIGYKVSGASSYTYVTISNNTYSLDKTNVVLSGVTFSADSAYDIEFYVGDYYSATTTTRNISTAFALMNFRSTGKGMAVGKVSERDAFEVGVNAFFHNNIYMGYDDNAEKDIRFRSSGGTYPHDSYIYGGNSAGSAAIGVYDGKNSRSVCSYDDVNNNINISTSMRSVNAFNRGSWNSPTKGLLTQVTDNSGSQHSVIVGLKSDGATRLYGIDLYDSDSSPIMRFFAGSSSFELTSVSELIMFGNIHASDGLLKSIKNGNTVTIGSQNASYCHIYNQVVLK